MIRLLRTTAYISKTRSVLTMLAKGALESRFINIWVACFVALTSIVAFVWIKDGLAMRCIVTSAFVPDFEHRSDAQKLVSDEHAVRLMAGESWSAISAKPPVFAQPVTYCSGAKTVSSTYQLKSLGSYNSNRHTQLCAHVSADDINDKWAWMSTFDNLGSCVLCMLIITFSQEWGELLLCILQGTSMAAVLFLILTSVGGFILVNFYSSMLYVTYEQAQIEAAEAKEKDASGTRLENMVQELHRVDNMQKERKDQKVRQDQGHDTQDATVSEWQSVEKNWHLRAFLQDIQNFEIKFFAVPVWDCALCMFAMLHFMSGCMYAGYIGRWRLLESGIISQNREASDASDVGMDEVIWGYCGPWSTVGAVCQWAFYVDLAFELARYGGFKAYLCASANHRANFAATVSVLVATYTWRVPDMTALRMVRLLSVVFAGRKFWWNRDFNSFFGKLLKCESDILHTSFSFLIFSLILQHLQDGMTKDNKFFGSWWASMASLFRLSADQDLLAIIHARLDIDGIAMVILVVICCFFIKTLLAKLVITSMNHGLLEPESRRILYQQFLPRAIQAHPKLEHWLKPRGSGHNSTFKNLCWAENTIKMFPQKLASF